MIDGLEHIRATLGDERQSALTDQEIKDALYEAYFDVEQAIAVLLGMFTHSHMAFLLTGPQRNKSESLLRENVKVSFIPVDPLPLPFACILRHSFSLPVVSAASRAGTLATPKDAPARRCTSCPAWRITHGDELTGDGHLQMRTESRFHFRPRTTTATGLLRRTAPRAVTTSHSCV